ncbi:MAG: hypothetical protein EPO32_00960 [Anaerolineae bacterium]|nr:MAG: hypothetical protein EPO32_00960 [Anaerolineae bacterium]
MGLVILGVQLDTVIIIDDDPEVRKSYQWTVSDLGLNGNELAGPLPPIDRFFQEFNHTNAGVLSDHKLTVKDYAKFNGAKILYRMYEMSIPAILCTTWETAGLDEIRKYRKNIPVMLNPKDLDPDTLQMGFEICIREFKGDFQTHRKSDRTLIRIEEFDKEYAYVVVPAWDSKEVIRLSTDTLPANIQEEVKDNTPYRLYASVNLGAEDHKDVYFDQWSLE